MKLNLCFFFGHKWIQRDEWTPSFDAEIITEFKFINICARCGKRMVTHGVWNGDDFDIVDHE